MIVSTLHKSVSTQIESRPTLLPSPVGVLNRFLRRDQRRVFSFSFFALSHKGAKSYPRGEEFIKFPAQVGVNCSICQSDALNADSLVVGSFNDDNSSYLLLFFRPVMTINTHSHTPGDTLRRDNSRKFLRHRSTAERILAAS
jgi:hypothetical protein